MDRLFLHRTNQRRLPEDYRGDVLLWDIDKTYLDTQFSSWRGLLGIPLEFAIDKRSIPGAVPLLRALRRGPGAESALVPLYFVSGSPPALRRVIERKMTLDGVDFDGITFKDQFGLLKAGRIREIKAQVGYKLSALLLYRRELPFGARWLLFGDDVEQDAETFRLFGEIGGGFVGAPLLARLEALEVPEDQARWITELASALANAAPYAGAVLENPVERIFIHLERGSDPSALAGDRTVASRSFLETALVLAHMGRIREEAIAAVAADLRARQIQEARIEADLWDAGTRLGVPDELIRRARR
jgi:hypothetical protein